MGRALPTQTYYKLMWREKACVLLGIFLGGWQRPTRVATTGGCTPISQASASHISAGTTNSSYNFLVTYIFALLTLHLSFITAKMYNPYTTLF